MLLYQVGAAPEEDEWEAFKSSSPTTSVPVEVDAVKTQQQQPLSDMFHGGNSSTLPEPQALLAELPPPQQQILSQHNEEKPFDLLAMGEQPQVTSFHLPRLFDIAIQLLPICYIYV